MFQGRLLQLSLQAQVRQDYFAALKLIEEGIKPIVLERGKDIRSRRRDLAILNKEGIINEESNYCFGEGGRALTAMENYIHGVKNGRR